MMPFIHSLTPFRLCESLSSAHSPPKTEVFPLLEVAGRDQCIQTGEPCAPPNARIHNAGPVERDG